MSQHRLILFIATIVAAVLTGCGPTKTTINKLASTTSEPYSFYSGPPAGTSGGNPLMVQEIAANRCVDCHAKISDVTNVADLAQMIVGGYVVPGIPEASSYYKSAMGTDAKCTSEKIPDPELQIIADWIRSL